MSYKTETSQVTAQFINTNFVRHLEAGRTKEAADEGTAFTREVVRQEAFSRAILPPTLLTDADIDKDVDTDTPRKIVFKEPDSEAVSTTFQGAGPRRWLNSKRYAVYMTKFESNRFTKSKFELMSYSVDIRKIVGDNLVRDIADAEDKILVNLADYCVNLNLGAQQNTGVFGSTLFKNGRMALLNRRQPLGMGLIGAGLYQEAIDLPATMLGSDVAGRHYDEGIENETKLWGMPFVTTIKSHVLPTNHIYLFAPAEYLGANFLLQDATLFLEQKADMIQFWGYEAGGMGIGKRIAMQRLVVT